jgi:Chaperone of endosialidase
LRLFSQKAALRRQTILNRQGKLLPDSFFTAFQSGKRRINPPGKRKNTIMNSLIQIKRTTRRVSDAIRLSPLRLAFCLIALVSTCFALLPTAQAATEGDLGKGNTVEGSGALQSNTTGIHGTALGFQALFNNTTGNYNTATGSQALKSNTTGNFNKADGFQALLFNTTGFDNTASGWRALFHNTAGDSNNATGSEALNSNTTGVWNEAYGFEALHNNVTGRENTAIGDSAGFDVTGSFNINIGSAVSSPTGENNTIRIGDNLPLGGLTSAACFIGGISGEDATGGDAVFILSNGKLGTVNTPSSARFKDEIKPMDKTSEAILALKPVTFHYKKEIDPKGIPQFGLVAEEVEKVNPDLVKRDRAGKLQTVRYEAVNAMLLNEFLKEHRTVQELKSTVLKQEATAAEQQKEIKVLTAALKEQAAQIQKVSAQLEMHKAAPQVVLNNP